MKITIPYGNYGEETRTVEAIDTYKSHFLILEPIENYKIISPSGLLCCIDVVSRVLKRKLPEVSLETFYELVDALLEIPDDHSNIIHRGKDFEGKDAPDCSIYKARTGNFIKEKLWDFQ